ncbi:UDP-N-acetylmuramate dehydrogenase [Flexithrix dorotheae]|uniref:UDP-N-acetylmuramate dehydrogenase n=1 Tax=Flexithrix dorotheae TaxID=70993 RepID=UPI000377860D|nr:UDP-N-acetylmuramate dehydrogenase [Flexithrix dorotheae]
MQLQRNISLHKLNTFGVQVKAQYFIEINSEQELVAGIRASLFNDKKILVLGGGSNILFTEDFEGVVIQNKVKGIKKIQENDSHVFIQIGGGENWHELVLNSISQGWQGIENLSLIPGTVGAAPIQNIGAYGVELKDVFVELKAIHLQTGELKTFSKTDCNFGYRQSIFKNELKGLFLITSVTLRLNKVPLYNVSYGDIQKTMAAQGMQELTAKNISDAVISIRTSKLPDPEKIGNCGSFFKNPEVPNSTYEGLKSRFPSIPGYPLANEMTKVPAGWLIQECGWKGKVIGNVGTYKNQALVIVNHGNATGKEAKNLALKIQASVKEKFGIEITPEVNII